MTSDRSMQRRFVHLLVAAMSLALAAQSCSKGGVSGVVAPSPDTVATVPVMPPAASLMVAEKVQLTATPENARGNPLHDRVVTWSSNKKSVATVDSSGLVTAMGAGSATITARCEGKNGVSKIVVADIPVASITVTPASATVSQSSTVQLTAALQDSSGNPLTGRTVTWSSSSTAVATVSSHGLVTAVAAGSATITAASGGKAATSAITVTASSVAPVASITVTPASATVPQSSTVQLTAALFDSSGNPLTGRTVTWSSNNTAVVTVNSHGLVSGVTAGSATITAASGGKSATSAITVTAVPVASVSVTPGSVSVEVGRAMQLTATPKDAGGHPLSGRAVSWTSSNTAVATVSTKGLVSGIATGSVTITATSEGQSGTSAVTVIPPSPPGSTDFGHVFVVTEENHNYSSVIGNTSMPYLNGLAHQYGLATNYYADTHPSIGNYFMLATGQIITNNDGYSTVVTVDNIVRRLLAAGKTWKSYAEGLPSVGFTGSSSGKYARKHNVFALLSDVVNDPGQVQNLVPFTQFATDLANGTLPAFSNIVPNLCNDAHDCSLGTADTWLANNIDPLLKSATFQKDGLLIIVFDEAGSDNTNGGGKIVWVAVSAKSKSGYQSTALYKHESTLRLILKALGATGFPGASNSAPDMDEFFLP